MVPRLVVVRIADGRPPCRVGLLAIYADDMSVLRVATNSGRELGFAACWCIVVVGSGCGAGEAEKFRALHQELNAVKLANIELENRLAERDTTIESLRTQLANLRASGNVPLEPLFEVDRIEILDLTSGVDTDGAIGDDAVAVYFRPVDRDGHVLKRGGEITIRLFDHVSTDVSRQVGEVQLRDAEAIRQAWYGRFWTNHYKVVVPFAPGSDLKPGQELDVLVEFVDAMTGRPFRARQVIRLDMANPG